MHIVLATGIYPPDIGGPATYVKHLAAELVERGMEVTVITYVTATGFDADETPWKIVRVPRSGGPFMRWRRFAAALRTHARDADVVYAFSSVSCGIPLRKAKLKKPKKILRLGGDFLWERYTDWGGRRTLKEFYAVFPFAKRLMRKILQSFDHIIFSTSFQENLYRRVYRRLPPHSVIENALPEREKIAHARHNPLKLLFMGRFVRFKNLPALLTAVAKLPHVSLTLVGDGPVAKQASALAQKLLRGRVSFLPSAHGEDKDTIFREHDVLILPSLTEISPHTAVEARTSGLPVLLSSENGLSEAMRDGMTVRDLRNSSDITRAVLEIDQAYEEVSAKALLPFPPRQWSAVAAETIALFSAMSE